MKKKNSCENLSKSCFSYSIKLLTIFINFTEITAVEQLGCCKADPALTRLDPWIAFVQGNYRVP